MTLVSLCRVPPENAHDQSVCTPSPAKNAAALTLAWCRVIRAGFALPRVRAGSRPSSPGGGSKPFLPLRRWPYGISSVGGVRAETGAIPAMGVFAAAALRAAVPAGGRRSKPSPPWRHQLYALSGPSALSASGRGCYSRQPVGGRCPLSTPRHVDQRPRVTRNRHPRQQVAMPWRALRAVSMRNAGCRALVSASPSLGWIRVHGRMKRWEFRGLRPRCRSEGPHRKDWPAFPRPISPVPADAAARRVPLR